MGDRIVELADELWSELERETEATLGPPPISHPARVAAIRATKAKWEAIGEAHAGRHREAAKDMYLNPPVGPG